MDKELGSCLFFLFEQKEADVEPVEVPQEPTEKACPSPCMS